MAKLEQSQPACLRRGDKKARQQTDRQTVRDKKVVIPLPPISRRANSVVLSLVSGRKEEGGAERNETCAFAFSRLRRSQWNSIELAKFGSINRSIALLFRRRRAIDAWLSHDRGGFDCFQHRFSIVKYRLAAMEQTQEFPECLSL